jgi:hypothetical protein
MAGSRMDQIFLKGLEDLITITYFDDTEDDTKNKTQKKTKTKTSAKSTIPRMVMRSRVVVVTKSRLVAH